MKIRDEVVEYFKEKQQLATTAFRFEELIGSGDDDGEETKGRGAHVERQGAKKSKDCLGLDELTYVLKEMNGWSFRFMSRLFNVMTTTVVRRYNRGAVKLYDKCPDCFESAPSIPEWMQRVYDNQGGEGSS